MVNMQRSQSGRACQSEGLIMSKIRYGLRIYRKPILEASTTRGSMCYRLQLLQNHGMRMIQGPKWLDTNKQTTHLEDLLEGTGFLSINQISACLLLVKFWNYNPRLCIPYTIGKGWTISQGLTQSPNRRIMWDGYEMVMRAAKNSGITSAYQMNLNSCENISSQRYGKFLLSHYVNIWNISESFLCLLNYSCDKWWK